MATNTFHTFEDDIREASAETAGEDQPITRREFLIYAWGASMALLAVEGGVASYFFLLPRFQAGEFGGTFDLGAASSLPVAGALPPIANTKGKFWLVHTNEGIKALYMVCTHLGCLYKWSGSNTRFECPCHGSKFTLNGDYIEGPAPRSLDQFEVQIIDSGNIIAVTQDTPDRIVPPSLSDPSAEVVIDTGKRILGKPAEQSPARRVS